MEMEGQARERNITIYPSEDNFLNLSTHIFSRTHLTFYPKYPKLLTFLSFKSDFELFPQSSAPHKLMTRTSTTKFIIYLPQKKNIDLSIHIFSRTHLTFYPKYPKLLTFLSFKSDFELFPQSSASRKLKKRTSTTKYIIYLPQKKNIDLSIHNFSRIHLTFYPKYPKLLTFLSFKSDFKLFPHSTASHNLVTRTSTTE